MSMSDPIADMFTRIRNAHLTGKATVSMPSSNAKEAIARLLNEEGYLGEYMVTDDGNNKRTLSITLRYYEGRAVIENLRRVSKPGLRIYRGKGKLPKVEGGLGMAIISTSLGLMSDRAARRSGHGGEIIGIVS